MMRTIDRRNNRRTSGRGPRALARWLLALVVGLGSSGLGETLWAQTRDIDAETKPDTTSAPAATSAPVHVEIKGTYWAVLIGIDEYEDEAFPDLKSAVKDVNAVETVLQKRYGFDHVIRRVNEQADRNGIINAFEEIENKAEENDSVFIYYAGHGHYDEKKDRGWWVPSDAKRDSGTYVRNAEIKDHMATMKALHVYLVADTCFSGSLLGENVPRSGAIENVYKKRSRQVLTSGDKETVDDGGKSDHSVFAESFLDVLKDNRDRYLMPDDIYKRVKPLVWNSAQQKPQSGPVRILRNGHEDRGGQFVFRLTDPTLVIKSDLVTGNGGPGTTTTITNPDTVPPDPKPENKWEKMLKLLDTLLKDKGKTS